jgi:hypothetical protein
MINCFGIGQVIHTTSFELHSTTTPKCHEQKQVRRKLSATPSRPRVSSSEEVDLSPQPPDSSAVAMHSIIGLGRLVWYCQVCQKQCRDENGFKMHSQSES